MNTNLFQTIATVLMAVASIGSTLLVAMGCSQNALGALDCSTATNAPVWMVPYLVIAASVLGIIKLVLAAFEGKLTAPTVPVPKPVTDALRGRDR
jgi:hypothetical protein